MRITAIETHVCHARMRNWVFVKVITDQPGLYGWGEATLEWHTRSIVGAIEDLSELVVGEDPRRIEHIWQTMYRQHFWHGNGIVRSTAIAGIDIALWDIAGKINSQPCSQLWGGPVRDTIRTYCHLGGGKMEDFYETAEDDASRFAELAYEAVEKGFTAFKCMAVPPTMPIEGLKPVRAAEAAVQAELAARGMLSGEDGEKWTELLSSGEEGRPDVPGHGKHHVPRQPPGPGTAEPLLGRKSKVILIFGQAKKSNFYV